MLDNSPCSMQSCTTFTFFSFMQSIQHLPIARIEQKIDRLKGGATLAIDGSGPSITANYPEASYTTADAAAIFQSQGLKAITEQLVHPVLAGLPEEIRKDLSLILSPDDVLRADHSNQNTLSMVNHQGAQIPFYQWLMSQGIPFLVKGDGSGPGVNHRLASVPGTPNVWEVYPKHVQAAIVGYKTHFLTSGKFASHTQLAAQAAATQGYHLILNGGMPLPEPDIAAMTSLDANTTRAIYMLYIKKYMKTLQGFFPGAEKDIGRLVGFKLGFVEDGEFTNGLRSYDAASKKKIAQQTTSLVKEVHKQYGTVIFRILTNGRPYDACLEIVQQMNYNLRGTGLSVGTSFSSAILSEVLAAAHPVVEGGTIRLMNAIASQERLKNILAQCQQASLPVSGESGDLSASKSTDPAENKGGKGGRGKGVASKGKK